MRLVIEVDSGERDAARSLAAACKTTYSGMFRALLKLMAKDEALRQRVTDDCALRERPSLSVTVTGLEPTKPLSLYEQGRKYAIDKGILRDPKAKKKFHRNGREYEPWEY